MGLARSVFIGFDPREVAAFAVARHSLVRRMSRPCPVHGLVETDLRRMGFLKRPVEFRDGLGGQQIMWDVISDAPQSTEHANARFVVPFIAPHEGWALFMDGDVLVREDIHKLFDELDPKFAVYCVKHIHIPDETTKMDAQIQTSYSRKNWSSVMAWNVAHSANAKLTLDMVNTLPGRDLHRLCWLEDREIGTLDVSWNYLIGASQSHGEPKIAHFTLGTPDMPGYGQCYLADEWRRELRHFASNH